MSKRTINVACPGRKHPRTWA